MALRPIAEDVWQIIGHPRHIVNCYLLGDVLVDTATRWARRRVLNDLREHHLRMVVLTHVHPDHQGLAALLCRERGIPLACHARDAPVMEGRTPMQPDNWIMRLGQTFWAGPSCPVNRLLQEGDEVAAGFRVVHAPGHTPGHVMLFRDADRVAIAGDVLANMNLLKRKAQLTEPPRFLSVDPAENRRSILKLADLNPRIVCFGHGPPLLDGWRVEEFAARYRRRADIVSPSEESIQ
jgi:hydroxyacylglutathione hydrolase